MVLGAREASLVTSDRFSEAVMCFMNLHGVRNQEQMFCIWRFSNLSLRAFLVRYEKGAFLNATIYVRNDIRISRHQSPRYRIVELVLPGTGQSEDEV